MPGIAEIYVEFRPTAEGGRSSPVWLGEDAESRYRPHLRVHNGDGTYLGIEFVCGPDRLVAPGEGTYATVRFMYEPEVSYDAVAVGATFDICEGGRVVGAGRVTRR